jgi:hypothetical protein
VRKEAAELRCDALFRAECFHFDQF